MPELPEIEYYKRYIDESVLKKKIIDVEITSTFLLQSPKSDFVKALKNNRIKATERLGKYLFLKTAKDSWLVLHFGMTGKVEYYANQDTPKYAHLILDFEEEYHLAFLCRRKLGKIFLTESVEKFKKEHTLGKDALDFKLEDFKKFIKKKSKSSLKAALTDQHNIAGIGNVYADEMLYHSGIHPKSRAGNLNENEIKELFKQLDEILNKAIDIGGKWSKFPKSFLIRHRKAGKDCPKCEGKIEMIKISGRSTYFCDKHQKLKE